MRGVTASTLQIDISLGPNEMDEREYCYSDGSLAHRFSQLRHISCVTEKNTDTVFPDEREKPSGI